MTNTGSIGGLLGAGIGIGMLGATLESAGLLKHKKKKKSDGKFKGFGW